MSNESPEIRKIVCTANIIQDPNRRTGWNRADHSASRPRDGIFKRGLAPYIEFHNMRRPHRRVVPSIICDDRF